jgi:hypothetical protein
VVGIESYHPLSHQATLNGSAISETVVRKQFILLVGVLLGSYVPMSAQTPTPQAIPAQHWTVMSMIVVPAPAPLFAKSFLLPENPKKSAASFSYLFARAYKRDQRLEDLKSLSPMREVKTLFLTQSMLPLLQLWGGRLRLDGFTSRLDMQSLQLGPSAAGGLLDFRPQLQGYQGGPRPIGFRGVCLSFHFGREAQIRRPAQIWQSLARIDAALR